MVLAGGGSAETVKEVPIAGPPKGCYVRELRSHNFTLCPRCSEDIRWAHAVWDLGSAELGSKDEKRLEGAIRRGRWRSARNDFQAAVVPADIRAWQAVRCPDDVVFVAENVLPYEVWEDDRVERIFALSDREQGEIEALAAGQWVRR